MLCQNFTQIRHQSPSHNGEFGSEAQENLGSLTTGLLVGFKISTCDKSFYRAMALTASLPHQAFLRTSCVCSATPCTLQQQAGVKAKVAPGGLDMPGRTPKKLLAPSTCLPHFSLLHQWCGYSQTGSIQQIPHSWGFCSIPELPLSPNHSIEVCQAMPAATRKG